MSHFIATQLGFYCATNVRTSILSSDHHKPSTMSPDRYETWKSTKTTKTWWWPPPRKPTPPPQPPSLPRVAPSSYDLIEPPRYRSTLNVDTGQPVSRVSIEYGRQPESRTRNDDPQDRSDGKATEEKSRLSQSLHRSERRPRTPSPASSSSSSSSFHSEEWALSPKNFTSGTAASAFTVRHSRDRVSWSSSRKPEPREDPGSRSRDDRPRSDVYIGNDGHRYIRAD